MHDLWTVFTLGSFKIYPEINITLELCWLASASGIDLKEDAK